MRKLPTGTVTLLFTDIEGSTHLLQQLGERYAGLLDECRHLLRAAFLEFHGQRSTRGEKPSSSPLLAPPMPSRRQWLSSVPSLPMPGRKV